MTRANRSAEPSGTWDDIVAEHTPAMTGRSAGLLLDAIPDTVRVALAWEVMPHGGNPPRSCRSWSDAWRGVEVPYAELAEAARVTERRARSVFDSLRSGRLVWPDGRIAPVVEATASRLILQATMVVRFGGRKKASDAGGKRSEPEPTAEG